MAKYKLTSNQMSVLNTVYKRMFEKLPDYEKKRYEDKLKREVSKRKIGEENYTEKEIERMIKKEIIEEVNYNFPKIIEEIFKRAKSISRASLNSIPTIEELIERANIKKREKIKKIQEKIKNVNEIIEKEIQKISSNVYKTYMKEYEKSLMNKRETKKKKDLQKIIEEIKRETYKKVENIRNKLPQQGIYKTQEEIKKEIRKKIEKELEKKEEELKIKVFGEEGYFDYRKEGIDMRKWEYKNLAEERMNLWRSNIDSNSRAYKTRMKEIEEGLKKYEKIENQIEAKHLNKMTADINRIKETKIEQKIKIKSEEIDISGLKIPKIQTYLNEVDTYEANRYDGIHVINVSLNKEGEIELRYDLEDNPDNWGYIPKGYDKITEAEIKINPALQSKELRKEVEDKIKKSKTIQNKIEQIRTYKKEIEKIKQNKQIKNIKKTKTI